MYQILKSTSKILAVVSILALVSTAAIADAKTRASAKTNRTAENGSISRTAVPADLSVDKLLGMDVWTRSGEKIAKIDDVILSPDGKVMDVVLDYRGEMVAVPIGDLSFAADHTVYAGTTSNLDRAKDFYVYGPVPYVYPRGYYGTEHPKSYQRGYYRSEPRTEWGMPSEVEGWPPPGMTGHVPYSGQQGPQGKFGLD